MSAPLPRLGERPSPTMDPVVVAPAGTSTVRQRVEVALRARRWLAIPLIGALLSRVWSLLLLWVAAKDRHLPLFGPGGVTASWDTSWYLQIAVNGYHQAALHLNPLGGQHDYAFFPLWPIVLHAVSFVPVSLSIAAAILSPILFCVAAVLIAAALEPVFGRRVAIDGVILLAFAPAAWTFSMGYSEALFLVLAAAAFLSTSPGRRAIAVALAVVTRVSGLPLIAVDGLRWIASRGRDLGALAVAIVGFLAFAAWWVTVALISGDPTGFLKGSPDWSPVTGVWAVLRALGHPEPQLLFALGIVAIMAVGGIVAFRRSWRMGTYALLTLALGLLPGGLVSSMPRYALAAFPAYAGLVSLGGRRLTIGLVALSAVAQVALVALSFPPSGSHSFPP